METQTESKQGAKDRKTKKHENEKHCANPSVQRKYSKSAAVTLSGTAELKDAPGEQEQLTDHHFQILTAGPRDFYNIVYEKL